jgi:hypothetical protein
MGAFWKAAFKRLGTSMLTTTAYHPQADGQSERTNQTVEIALRFAIANHPESKWPELIPNIQAVLNNSVSYATGHTPTEMMYEFRVREGLNVMHNETDQTYQDITDARTAFRQQATESIDFTNITTK